MGHFANATEASYYAARWCNRCVHENLETGCPVWNAHEDFCYQLCNKPEDPGKQMLDSFIPRKGIDNKKCLMFINRNKLRNG